MTKKFSFQKWEGMNEVGEGEELPMSKKLKPNQYIVLNAIAMFQGHGGYCDTTQEQLSQVIPYSRRAINDTINSLLEFTYAGKPVLEKSKKTGVNGKEQNVYRLLENPLFGVFGEKPSEPLCEEIAHNEAPLCEESSQNEQLLCEESSHTKETKITKEVIKELEEPIVRTMKNKEVIQLFCEAYEKKKLEKYKVVWSRDNKFTTKFLTQTEDLKNNEIKQLVELIVENYESWSTNSAKFPLSIMTLSTEWIQTKARDLLKNEKEAVSQIETRSVEATKRNETSVSSILGRIKKKGGA